MTTDAPADTKSAVARECAAARHRINHHVEAQTKAFLDSVDSGSLNFPDASAWSRAIEQSVSGGKRFRALCAQIGAAVAVSQQDDTETAPKIANPATVLARAQALPGVEDLAIALEQYQAAALVHDDIIDRATTRRGAPALHIEVSQDHARRALLGESAAYGVDGAILAGDLLLAAAEASLAKAASSNATENTTDRDAPVLARYAQMAGEVALGQFRDMSASYLPLNEQYADAQTAVEATLDVVRIKAARYSVVHPAVLGALQVGCDADLVHTLETILEPAGLAFQLRDDALGAFGDPSVTGKPVGIDIAEGKRTVLLALSWQEASEEERIALVEIHSNPSPDPADIATVVKIMETRGNDHHEALIEALSAKALRELEDAPLSANAKSLLRCLVDILVVRDT